MKQLTDLNKIIGKTIECATDRGDIVYDFDDAIFLSFTSKEFMLFENKHDWSGIDYDRKLSIDCKNYKELFKLGLITQLQVDEFLKKEASYQAFQEKKLRIKEIEELNRLMKKHGYIYGGSK